MFNFFFFRLPTLNTCLNYNIKYVSAYNMTNRVTNYVIRIISDDPHNPQMSDGVEVTKSPSTTILYRII